MCEQVLKNPVPLTYYTGVWNILPKDVTKAEEIPFYILVRNQTDKTSKMQLESVSPRRLFFQLRHKSKEGK